MISHQIHLKLFTLYQIIMCLNCWKFANSHEIAENFEQMTESVFVHKKFCWVCKILPICSFRGLCCIFVHFITHDVRDRGRSVIEGARIHIFGFCLINFFCNLLFSQFVNPNIWIWGPSITNPPCSMPYCIKIIWNFGYVTDSLSFNEKAKLIWATDVDLIKTWFGLPRLPFLPAWNFRSLQIRTKSHKNFAQMTVWVLVDEKTKIFQFVVKCCEMLNGM